MSTQNENQPGPAKEPEKPNKNPLDTIISYASGNTRDVIAYVLLILGIIMLLSSSYFFWGALLIGLILGFYFNDELTDLAMNFTEKLEAIGLVKGLVIAAALLGVLIAAPGFIIGAALAIGIKHLALEGSSEKKDSDSQKK